MSDTAADLLSGRSRIAGSSRVVTRSSPAIEKIRLFRSLFRGRSDVYARRFESRKTGKAGYAPACAHEWIRGLCDKPRIKCADCPNRRFLPLTDHVIESHLSGADEEGRECVIGIYPMLLDETCFLLAADFDGAEWESDAHAYLETCRRLDLPAALERSRSGKGAHVWLFFEEAVPASLARKLGSHVLTETMEMRPEIGFASYDRLFPNQDTLPKGGFGNLIALPLQHLPRREGNTLFLDDDMRPHPDQWSFLASVGKIGRRRLEQIAASAEAIGRVMGASVPVPEGEEDCPWLAPSRRKNPPVAGPLPDRLEVTLADQLYVAKRELSPSLRNRLVRLAAFQKP